MFHTSKSNRTSHTIREKNISQIKEETLYVQEPATSPGTTAVLRKKNQKLYTLLFHALYWHALPGMNNTLMGTNHLEYILRNLILHLT